MFLPNLASKVNIENVCVACLKQSSMEKTTEMRTNSGLVLQNLLRLNALLHGKLN